MFRATLFLLVSLCLAAVVVAPLSAGSETVTVVRITNSVDIAAPPSAVWAAMTAGDLSWCPYWKADANKMAKLGKIGDVLVFEDDWGNGGNSIVTYFEPNVEMRIAHEPRNGSYMCQSRLKLSEAGDGTTVTYVEQYTDEGSEADRKATATSMEAAIDKTLKTLKKIAEKG